MKPAENVIPALLGYAASNLQVLLTLLHTRNVRSMHKIPSDHQSATLIIPIGFIGPIGIIRTILFFFILFFSLSTWSQVPSLSDSAKTQTIKRSAKVKRPGFDLPDSLFIARDSVRGDIDTIVYYTAVDSSVF